MRQAVTWILPCFLLLTTPAAGDEVIFKNGNHLTGTITGLEGGKLSVGGTVAGDVVVDMTDVQTLSTDAPIEIRLNDGTVLEQKAVAGDAGTFETEAGPVLSAQVVPLEQVEKINPPKPRWKGNINAGGMLTSGNSETTAFNLGVDAVRRGEIDRISFGGGYLFGRQENDDGEKETNTDNWFVTGKYDYFLTKKLYPFGLVRVEKDRIADLDLRLWPIAGIGYQWFERPEANFATELGFGWVFEDYRNEDSREHFAGRLAYHYDRRLFGALGFFHNVEYLPSLEDSGKFNLNLDVGIRATLVKSLFSEMKMEWSHDSQPAEDADRNDQRYIMSLGWAFE